MVKMLHALIPRLCTDRASIAVSSAFSLIGNAKVIIPKVVHAGVCVLATAHAPHTCIHTGRLLCVCVCVVYFHTGRLLCVCVCVCVFHNLHYCK